MTVNVSASFTKEARERNGLNAIEGEILDSPRDERVAVVLFTGKFAKEDFDEGVTTPTVKFDHIEPLKGEDAEHARKLLEEAYRDRTGNQELPLDYSGEGE